MPTIRFLIFIVSVAVAFNPLSVTAAAAVVPECNVESLPSTAEQLQNPGQEPIAFLFAKGVRVFNCSTGKPSLNSGGLVNITDGGLIGASGSTTNWTGIGYYPDSEDNGTFALNEIISTTGAPLGKDFFLTLDYSTVKFIPAPDGAALDWARWNVYTVPRTLQEELGIGWGSRIKTVGGEAPKDCSNIFFNMSVVVDYTAYYYFYQCPSSNISTNSSTNSSSNSSNNSSSPLESQAGENTSIATSTALTSSKLLSFSIALFLICLVFI